MGAEVQIRTDHRPLVWLLAIATPSGRTGRWRHLIAEYNIDPSYIPGHENSLADALSRYRAQSTAGDYVLVVTKSDERNKIKTKHVCPNQQAVQQGSDELLWNIDEIAAAQEADPWCGKLIDIVLKI